MSYQPSVGVSITKKVAFAKIGTSGYVENVWHYGVVFFYLSLFFSIFISAFQRLTRCHTESAISATASQK